MDTWKLLTMSDFVSWLNSMTSTELKRAFPGTFRDLTGELPDKIAELMYINDAIMWRLVKEYNQFLLQPLKESLFVGENKIFEGFEKGEHPSAGTALINMGGTRYCAWLKGNKIEWLTPWLAKQVIDLADTGEDFDYQLIKCPVK